MRWGVVLDLAALVTDEDTVVVVHTMPKRSKYAHLCPENEDDHDDYRASASRPIPA